MKHRSTLAVAGAALAAASLALTSCSSQPAHEAEKTAAVTYVQGLAAGDADKACSVFTVDGAFTFATDDESHFEVCKMGVERVHHYWKSAEPENLAKGNDARVGQVKELAAGKGEGFAIEFPDMTFSSLPLWIGVVTTDGKSYVFQILDGAPEG